MAAHGKSGYAVIANFLQKQGTLIEKYMQEKLMANAKTKKSAESEGSPESDDEANSSSGDNVTSKFEERVAKLIVAKIKDKKAGRSQDGATSKRQATEKSAGKCPICLKYHYFRSMGRTQGTGAGQRSLLCLSQVQSCDLEGEGRDNHRQQGLRHMHRLESPEINLQKTMDLRKRWVQR